MTASTDEGRVVNGQIQLTTDVRLPDNARVLITVDDDEAPYARIASPRLADREKASDFVLEVEKVADAES